MYAVSGKVFLSTPSARRATRYRVSANSGTEISIHALREEGDEAVHVHQQICDAFLSTPSARRATHRRRRKKTNQRYFYPRPPRGGRRPADFLQSCRWSISIHALREEGDGREQAFRRKHVNFYPRPPRGGRLANLGEQAILKKISIHALREEGDLAKFDEKTGLFISIHALREEGD